MSIAVILTRKRKNSEPAFVRHIPTNEVGSKALDRNGQFMVVVVDQKLNLQIKNWDKNECQIVPKWRANVRFKH